MVAHLADLFSEAAIYCDWIDYDTTDGIKIYLFNYLFMTPKLNFFWLIR